MASRALVHAALAESAASLPAVLAAVDKSRNASSRFVSRFRQCADAVMRLASVGSAEQNEAGTRQALRDLYISMPLAGCDALSPAAVQAYTAVLQHEVTTAELTDARDLPEQAPGLSVWQGDMSRLRADAVVNPGNNALLGCFLPEHKCLDNILHGAAGPELRIACGQMLRDLGVDEDTNGQCRVTPAFALPATHVFHTVGPCLVDPSRRRQPPRAPTAQDRKELASCYSSCLDAAERTGCRTLAFCCISTGIFGYPGEEAASIAISTVMEKRARMASAGQTPPKVVFNVFKDEDLAIYMRLLPEMGRA